MNKPKIQHQHQSLINFGKQISAFKIWQEKENRRLAIEKEKDEINMVEKRLLEFYPEFFGMCQRDGIQWNVTKKNRNRRVEGGYLIRFWIDQSDAEIFDVHVHGNNLSIAGAWNSQDIAEQVAPCMMKYLSGNTEFDRWLEDIQHDEIVN